MFYKVNLKRIKYGANFLAQTGQRSGSAPDFVTDSALLTGQVKRCSTILALLLDRSFPGSELQHLSD